jgi:hypothetical protein
MKRQLRYVGIAAVGILVGAVVTLALPAPGERQASKERAEEVPVQKVQARTLLAWTSGRLPDGIAEAARGVEGVGRVAEVRSAAVWLDRWEDDAGRVHTAGRGRRIPIEIAAVDPETYTKFVPAAERASVSSLARGGVVLGQGGARLRGITSRGALTFGRNELAVGDVIHDSLIGAHEGLVSFATGERLGITRPRYLLVELRRDASMESVERKLRALPQPASGIRIRAPGETPEFRHGDAVLPQLRMKELFGEFSAVVGGGGRIEIDPAWVSEHIVSRDVPILGSVTCHERIIPQLDAAFQEIERRGLSGLVDAGDYGGCYSPRFLNADPAAGISHHSWGVAFDINLSQNPFGLPGRMDDRIIEILERWGFTWGGRWLVPDAMHFEFLRSPLSPKG